MYAATMRYPVKDDSMMEFVKIWEEKILNIAVDQPGFVSMQLLTRGSQAMAIGQWESKRHAEEFMALGVFSKLMASLEGLLTGTPQPTVWSSALFVSRESR